MPTIDKLSSADTLAPGDVLPLYQQTSHDARKVALPVLASYLHALNVGEPDETVYGLAVADSTFTASVEPSTPGGNTWLLLKLSGAFSAGTITLPGSERRRDGQEVLVTSTHAVTALTINGGGAAVNGAPVALTANGFFRLRYDSASVAWFRIG